MEKRKIQKVGRSTLSVTLPKEWTKLADVKQGDTVYLDQKKNNALIILSEKLLKHEERSKEFYINCDMITEPKLLGRFIVGSYIQGADTIKIFSSTRIKGNQIEDIRNIIRKLIGLSIIEESSKEIILQCSIDPTKFEIYSLIKRLSVISSTMLEESLEALIELNPEFASDVIKREEEANSIFWLITRLSTLARASQILADKIGLKEPIDPSIRLVSKNLERVADCSENIAKIVLDMYTIRNEIDKKELEKIMILTKITKEMFKKAVDSFFSKDMINANEVHNLREKIDNEARERRRKAVIPYFRAITVMLSMIAENSASIAVLTINIVISESNHLP